MSFLPEPIKLVVQSVQVKTCVTPHASGTGWSVKIFGIVDSAISILK